MNSMQSKTSELPVKKSVSLQSLNSIDVNDLMVKIRNMSFSYFHITSKKSQNILNDINLSLPKSTIYGLLGPSGCGKTTLLKIILGLHKPKCGTVEVNGRPPLHPLNKIPGSGVGFMPQELALYSDFSIQEILDYFAQIYGMSKDIKKERIEFLTAFLELTDSDRRIKILSGGEQRRVSLAVAFVHKPQFLILDEPTVGVDPLLREKIWEHLVLISAEDKTSILITTHYIEEAGRANVIAMLRSGSLLVEQPPKILLERFKVQNLEQVFLNICKIQLDNTDKPVMAKSFIETIEAKKMLTKVRTIAKDVKIQALPLESNFWKRFKALLKKNYIRMSRDLTMLLFQILTPTLTMILFCICVGSTPEHLKVALYNEEDLFHVTQPNQCLYNNYSHYFVNEINKQIVDLITYDSNKSAILSVKKSKTFGALIIDQNFSRSLCLRAQFSQTKSTNSEIKFFSDMTDVTIVQTILRAIFEAQSEFERIVSPIVEQILLEQNLTFKKDSLKPEINVTPVYGSINPSFRDFMTPGMMICIIFVLAVGLTTLSFVGEKREGLLERTLLTGVRIYEILFAQIFVQIFILFLQITVLMVIIFPIFNINNKGNYGLVVFINLLQGVAGMSYGLLISLMAPDEQSALMFAFGSFFPVILLSGVFWPIEGMKYGLQNISYLLPQTLSVITLRHVLLKGFGLTVMSVWLGYVSSIIWIVFFITTAIIISKFSFLMN